MRRFRNKSTEFTTAEMCFNYFSSSVKTLISLWMFSCLFDLALGQCHGEADIICKDIGSADDHRNALISAFSGNHEIDLIFIICNTTDCTKAYSKVISFIVNLVALVSTKYESYIDAKRLHIAMIVYDNTLARVTLNDIQEATPKVGNCEFDKFLNNSMASYEARGTTDGLLTESLKEANTVFSQSARSKARKILWLFSDCRCCGPSLCDIDKTQEVKNAVGDIKRGYLNNVFVFTGGITQCPNGWFYKLSQEDTMKTIASTNSSHYACIDKWIDFTNMEIHSGNISEPWSEISKDVNIGASCKECANSTSSSSYRCGCKVTSKQYMCHVITIAVKQVSSYTEACIGEFCFATPGSNELRNCDGAKSWCTNNNSDLAVVNNSDVQLALTQFLNSFNTKEMTLINLRLYLRIHTWYLVNGSNYDGNVANQDYDGYKLYGCLKSDGNYFQVDASKPNETNRYICDFEDTRCINLSTNNILYNGRCYVKYESETLTWFKARERCYNNGGDLATFQSRDITQLTTSWLNSSFTYWVGIRWNDRSWKSSDGGNEAIYTSWSSEKPNNNSNQCVCVDPNGRPAWSWTDCNCEAQRQFVCLKIVPTAATSTTTTTRAPTIITTSEVTADLNPNSTANALILGLVLGIILPLIIVIIVLIIIIVHQRRQARDKPTFVQQDRSGTELNTTVADTQYQHLQKGSTPIRTTQLYEPLSQPDIRDYESVPEMT